MRSTRLMITPPDILLTADSGVLQGKGTLAGLTVLGAVALLLIGYLVVDWCNSRRAARRLQEKRRMAQESWEQERRDVE